MRIHRDVPNTDIEHGDWWYDPSEDAYCRVRSATHVSELNKVHLVLESIGRNATLSGSGVSQIVREESNL